MRNQGRGKQSGLLFGINRLTNKFLKEVTQKLRPIIERELVERICKRLGVNLGSVTERPANQKKKRVSPKTKPAIARTGKKSVPPLRSVVNPPAESSAPKESVPLDNEARLKRIKALARAKDKQEEKPSRPRFAPSRLLPPQPKVIAPTRAVVDPPVILPEPTKQSADLPASLLELEPKTNEPPNTDSAPASKPDDINRRHLDKIF